jgi:hypothetical protein
MLFSCKNPPKIGFPAGFKVQPIALEAARAIAQLPAAEIAKYFLDHPESAKRLLLESYDKRFTPSTFMMEEGDRFKVGWFSRQLKYECVKEFADLADAATDYLLFSLGIDRWTPHETKG